MRIGISVFGCAGGKTKGSGTSVYSKNLIKNLAIIDKVNEYYIFLSKDNEQDFWYIAQNNFHFKVIAVRETGFTRLIFEQFILPVLNIIYKIDVMHYTMPRMSFMYMSNSVITVHDLMYKYYNENYQGYMPYFKYLYFDLNMKRVLKKANKIIAVSKYTAKDLQHYFRAALNKINVVYEGVDPVFFKQPSEDIIKNCETKNKKYILTVKSNFPHKNLKGILEAFILAKKKYNILHKLIILGYPGLISDELSQIIKKSNLEKEIVFIDSVSEETLITLYKKASLFIFLSLNEGFGLPILEAMAAGVPVLCSNRASLPEIAQDAAVIVDPLDVDKIAETINACLSNEILRKEMIDKGLQRANGFSWRQTALQTLEVYNSAKA